MSRTRVCLDCRTVVAELAACPGGARHRIVDLASAGRSKLVDEVWGPPSWRRERRRLARAGGSGAAAGGLGEIFSGCDGCSGLSAGGEFGEILGALFVVLAVALMAMVVVWVLYKLIAYVHRKRNEPKPNGALLPPVRPAARRRIRGFVQAAAPDKTAPLTGEPCVGWALELACRRLFSTAVMLRDGASYGFDVRLDDGRTARVPPGLLRLEGSGGSVDLLTVHDYLTAVDPAHAADDEEPAIPFDRARSVTIHPGDEVELVGELVLAPDPEAPQTYRGATAMVLVPREPLSIRRL